MLLDEGAHFTPAAGIEDGAQGGPLGAREPRALPDGRDIEERAGKAGLENSEYRDSETERLAEQMDGDGRRADHPVGRHGVDLARGVASAEMVEGRQLNNEE